MAEIVPLSRAVADLVHDGDSALGSCERDNDAYVRWDAVSRDRDGFLARMRRNVLDAAGRLA